MNLTQALGWTLLHFLWQGALIAILLATALAIFKPSSARVRYGMSCAALLLMVLCAAATMADLKFRATPSPRSLPTLVNLAGSAIPAVQGMGSVPREAPPGDYLPALVWAWLGGVIGLSLRSLGGWAVAVRFARRNTWAAEEVWNSRFTALAHRVSISRPVRLAVSALADVPAVVGWLRPVVLVPARIFTGLTAEQIEALLAHELAHVRRYDYLVNLLQTAAETLLFYHPAVWWVSRNIRNEREHCCDDLAIEVCGNTLAYVRALTELEQMRHGAPRLAMAADGGSLLGRVQRLLHTKSSISAPSSGWIACVGIVAALLVAGVARNGLAQRPESPAASNPEPAPVTLLAQQNPPPTSPPVQARPSVPAPAKAPEKKSEETSTSSGWLEQIQAEGYRNLSVDQLISLKIHGVTGDYIREMRAGGMQLTADQLVSFRIHGVTGGFVNELKQAGLQNLKPDDLISFRIHGADADFIRQIQALGYPMVSADQIVSLRIHGITPEFIREAQRNFKDVTIDQLIQLKRLGILRTSRTV